jgi:ectoine hydroxylase-related dioxygenase (phytanoyl-CoA dioxygenase family)
MLSEQSLQEPFRRLCRRAEGECLLSIRRTSETTSVEALHEALEHDGVVVIEGLSRAGTMCQIKRELAPWLEGPIRGGSIANNAFTGMATLRTSALVRKSAGCRELVMHPLVLEVLDRVLGPQCSRFQLSFTQAIRIGPGEQAQVAHRDTAMYPFARPGPEVFVNAIWALDDFSIDNGCTRFYLGSHRWDDERIPDVEEERTASATMPSGSVVLYYGSVWHGGGANKSERDRTGISFGYTLGWLRQEENQYLAVPPDVARTYAPDLQQLLGYAEHSPFLEWYEGQDDEVFRGGQPRQQYRTEVRGGVGKSVRQILRDGSKAVGRQSE